MMRQLERSDGKRYDTIADAARELIAEQGAGQVRTVEANICTTAKKLNRTAYGYGWRWVEPMGDAYDEALRRIAALETLVMDMYGAWCATVDDYYAENIDGYYERINELGIEVDA